MSLDTDNFVQTILRTQQMKPDVLYQKLKELADKLSIEVSEQNFRSTGGNARSGLCKVRGRDIFFVDKHLTLKKKAQALAACLADIPIEQVYMLPAVREYIDACRLPDQANRDSG